ncbi:MAG: radical SAM family heme chaperone HemW [Chloroflexi bacterium]|nr:radical SAM family heme chaperone HemW [Chloroflexota bacterium]
MSESIAVYVHFPFCLSICPYCDFDRQATGFDRIDAYLDAVRAEARRYEGLGLHAHSVFFGGGTPSLMRPDQVSALLKAVRRMVLLDDGAEVTLEANPGDADAAKMRGFRAAGVNRVSMGVQSLDPAYLQLLGRRHSVEDVRRAARWAKDADLRLNLDLIYGLPSQSLEHWRSTLEAMLALSPDHLSCYLLTVDEKVPMGRDVARGRLRLPDDDALAAQYDLARAVLATADYEQYEISNWARPGEASRHNLTYWRDGQWIGLGAGAASSFEGRRWKNTPALERYIGSIATGGAAARVEDEPFGLADAMLDFLTLGLRLREGVSAAVLRHRFQAELGEVLGEEGQVLLDGGVLERTARGVRIASERQLVTNEVLARLAPQVAAWASERALSKPVQVPVTSQ